MCLYSDLNTHTHPQTQKNRKDKAESNAISSLQQVEGTGLEKE